MSRRVVAAGLLSLAFVAACSDDADRRRSALPPVQEETSSPPAATAAASPEDDDSSSTPVAPPARRTTSSAAAAGPPAAVAAAPKAQPQKRKSMPAAPRPAAEPSPTRTTAQAPAPAPTRTTAPAPAPAGQFALTIRDFAFDPQVLTVPVGSTVTATNEDEAVHDWTSDRGVWGSGDLRRGEMFSFTFKDVGKYDFLCERHPSMTGTVNVTPR